MSENNIFIKNNIMSFVNKCKKDNDIKQKIAFKIEELVNNIKCFFCLDEKQCWDYRGQKFKGDGKGEFYRKICKHCLNRELKILWIEDSITNELFGPFGIKLFRYDSQAGSDRFIALEEYVVRKNQQLLKPEYNKSSVDSIHTNKKTYKIEVELGNIINTCKQAIEAYAGNIPSMINLIKNIKLNISNFEEESNKNTLICEEIEKNHFLYVAIKNNSSKKNKKFCYIYNYEKFYLDIQIDIFEIKTLNESAHHMCSKIVNDSAEKNIHDIIKLFELNYEHSDVNTAT